MVAELGEESVQQGRYSGLAISACHTHQRELFRWITIPGGSKHCKGKVAVLNLDVCNIVREFFWKRVAHHCCSSIFNNLWNEGVSIYIRSSYCNKKAASLDLAAVLFD